MLQNGTRIDNMYQKPGWDEAVRFSRLPYAPPDRAHSSVSLKDRGYWTPTYALSPSDFQEV